MSKKGGKRKKQQSNSQRPSGRPSVRSVGPKSSKRVSAAPTTGATTSAKGETLRFESQPLSLPTSSSERLEAAPPSKLDEHLPPIHEEEKQETKAEAAKEIVPEATEASSKPLNIPTPSDISIPPVVESEEMDRFFAEGDRVSRDPRPSQAVEIEEDPRSLHKHAPAVVARRQRFAKYVKLAVAGAALLCLAAAVRGAVAKMSQPTDSRPVAVAAAKPADPKPAETAASADPGTSAAVAFGVNTTNVPTPTLAGQGAQATAAAAPADDKPSAPADDKAAAQGDDKAAADKAAADKGAADKGAADKAATDKPADDKAAAAAAPAAAGDKTAAQEKKASQAALERGKIQEAIDAGERSVALDPTDGEAWLILGAAYQMKGKAADARRCFISCTKQGKKGPIGECAAMLR
jgi:hypothetical protein